MLHARILKYLDEVVRQGSIRKAAERLNVSASSISRQILSLEEQAGVALFDRSGQRLALTAAGELLIRHVRETMREMAQTWAAIEQLKGLKRGLLRIGMMSGLAANMVPVAATRLRERSPRVDLQLKLFTTGEQILAAIEAGEVELGIGFDFSQRPLARIVHSAIGRLGAVMRPGHPLTTVDTLRLSDCTAYPLALPDPTTAIRPYVDQAFENAKLEPLASIVTNSIEIMRQMALVGDTICFLTPFDCEAEQRAHRLVYRPVRELARHAQRLMIIENERRSNPLAGLFAEQMKLLIKEVEAGAVAAEPL